MLKVNGKTFHGIPREQIPWGPKVNYEKCVSCGKCVTYCKLGIYDFEEAEGKKKPVVVRPNNCVVFCKGCQDVCPAGAISHPSRKETQELIGELRRAAKAGEGDGSTKKIT
ncbi:MAG: ferredoxin family protein [Candidatus Bathyarchaeia archaeon]|jgi:NAD-dependent dihydropyrimidine dehydrogenase PreA subunit